MSDQVLGMLLVFGPLALLLGWGLWVDAWAVGMLLLTVVGCVVWAAGILYGLTLLGWLVW